MGTPTSQHPHPARNRFGMAWTSVDLPVLSHFDPILAVLSGSRVGHARDLHAFLRMAHARRTLVLAREDDMISVVAALVIIFGGGALAYAGPLHDAARDGDLQQVRQLIGQGADMNAPGDNGEPPLILAILGGHSAAVDLLIEKGADIGARNKGGFTPLHAAAYVDDGDAAELLLAKGADVNDQQNKAGVTPLSVAAEEGRASVAQVLIEHGADLDAAEQNGYTPLTRAVWRGHKDVVMLLRQSGAECQPVEILEEPGYSQCVAAQP
jgi:uncharacterized protein